MVELDCHRCIGIGINLFLLPLLSLALATSSSGGAWHSFPTSRLAGKNIFKASVAASESSGVFYVDNILGVDTNSGLSPTAPFKSIAHINELALLPGQTVVSSLVTRFTK